jgi:hypothetical protein
MASGPATITVSAALQLLAVLLLPWRIGCGWQ